MLYNEALEFDDAEKLFDEIKTKLQDEATMLKNMHFVEDDLINQGRELSRRLLQGYLRNCGNGDIGKELMTSENVRLTHKRSISRTIHSFFGSVILNRIGYSNRGKEIIYPLDAFLNLPSTSFSYALQKFLVKEVAKGSIDDALQLVYEVTGVKISKGKAIQLIEASSCDFDDFYEEKSRIIFDVSPIPLLVLTTDAKGIVMRPEGLRETTKKRRVKTEHKHKTRLSKGEKRNSKRMAQVASIYYIDRFRRNPKEVFDECCRRKVNVLRPKPVAKRLWASVEKDAVDVIDTLVQEAKRRDCDQKKEWVVLVDGQDYQIDQMKASLKRHQVQATIVLDIVHAIEYLWKAAHQFFEEGSFSCERWVESKLEQILESGGRKTARSIRMSAAKRLAKEKRTIVEKSATYLADRSSYTNYHDYLKKGYPIGTGVIEGACRYLVKDRMDITGARWGLAGAEAVLKIRSILKSQNFDEYWNYHIDQEYQRNYMTKFFNPLEIL